jgi:shikimate kinase
MATGGGVVLNPENRRLLHDTGWVVYLNVPPMQLFERTRHDRNRPLLRVPDPLAKLEELHAARDPLYREAAHITIEGGRLMASGVVHYLLREFTHLCKP